MIMKWHHINVHIQYIVEISFTELCCISQQASGSNKQAADVRHQTTDIRYYTSDIRLRNLLSGIRQGIEQQSLETRQRTSDIVLQVSVKTTGSRHQTTGSSQQTSDLRRQASAVAFLCGVACWLLPYACHMHDACVWCLLPAVCSVCCRLSDVCHLMSAVWCLMAAAFYLTPVWLMPYACCLLFGAWCCCLLSDACCLMSAVS